MTTTITLQNRLTLTEAGRLVGKSPSAVFRWMKSGVRGEKLDALFLGGSLYTSAEALEDFGRRVAVAKLGGRDERPRVAERHATVEAGL